MLPDNSFSYSQQILHLRILSGQQLPRPRGSTAKAECADPFVVVELFGAAADCAEERTKTVRNDSEYFALDFYAKIVLFSDYAPSWDESFQFVLTQPQLALLRFMVLDDDYIGEITFTDAQWKRKFTFRR